MKNTEGVSYAAQRRKHIQTKRWTLGGAECNGSRGKWPRDFSVFLWAQLQGGEGEVAEPKHAKAGGDPAAAEAIRKEVLAGYEGMEDDVLLETPLSGTLFTGYTRLYVPVVVSAPGHASGEIVRVRLGAYDGERVRAALV